MAKNAAGYGMRRFHAADYVMMILSLVLSLGVGIFQGFRSRRTRNTSEYLMGSRELPCLPVAMSLTASFISSIALIGLPSETYYFGMQTLLGIVGKIVGVAITFMLFIPMIHPLKLTSAQEYLELRFKSKSVRLIGTFFSLLYQLVYSGCVVYGQSAALEATTGMPAWASAILVNGLGTLYTAVGGMKAVIWTDVFQVVVMYGSIICVIITGLVKVGGPVEMWNLNSEWGRIFVNFEFDLYTRMTFWSLTLGGIVGWAQTLGVSQASVQRYCAISTIRDGQKSMIAYTVGSSVFGIMCVFAGMVVFAYYAQMGCDPLLTGHVPNTNQILPFFVMNVLYYPGLPGLFVAGLFSGSLSTISSCINSMSAVFWEDILKWKYGQISDTKQVTINQISAFVFGAMCLGITFLVTGVGGGLVQVAFSLFGILSGPSIGTFLLGAMVPWGNWIGAIVGALGSLALNTWMMVGQIMLGAQRELLASPNATCFLNNETSTLASFTMTSEYFRLDTLDNAAATGAPVSVAHFEMTGLNRLYAVSFMWYTLTGTLTSLFLGIIVSFLTGATDPSTIDKRLLFVFLRRWYGRKEVDEMPVNDQDLKVMNPLMDGTKNHP